MRSTAQKSQAIHRVISSVLKHASSLPYLIIHFTVKELKVFRLYVLISSSARSRRAMLCTAQSLSYYFFFTILLNVLSSFVYVSIYVVTFFTMGFFLMRPFFTICSYVAVCRFCAVRCVIIIYKMSSHCSVNLYN